MKSLELHGETIKQLNSFVKDLEPSIQLETFKFLLDVEQKQPTTKGAGVPAEQTPKGERGFSPQERLRLCNVSSAFDKALVLGFWLEEDQKKESFTSLDLREAFMVAREPVPANASDVVARLDGAGKVMKAEKTGKVQSYRLTRSGIEQVESWMNGLKGDEQ